MRAYKTAVRRRLAERVTAARKRQGLTHEQLAERAGIGVRELSRVANARVNVSIDIVSALAAALSVDVHDLFSPNGDRLEPAFPILTPEDLEALDGSLGDVARLRRSLRRRRRILLSK
jgi:transcriptional regulator with XRE-family HTH domain